MHVHLTLCEIFSHPQMLYGQEVGKVYCLNLCVETGGVSAAPNPEVAPSLGETGKRKARDLFFYHVRYGDHFLEPNPSSSELRKK